MHFKTGLVTVSFHPAGWPFIFVSSGSAQRLVFNRHLVISENPRDTAQGIDAILLANENTYPAVRKQIPSWAVLTSTGLVQLA